MSQLEKQDTTARWCMFRDILYRRGKEKRLFIFTGKMYHLAPAAIIIWWGVDRRGEKGTEHAFWEESLPRVSFPPFPLLG